MRGVLFFQNKFLLAIGVSLIMHALVLALPLIDKIPEVSHKKFVELKIAFGSHAPEVKEIEIKKISKTTPLRPIASRKEKQAVDAPSLETLEKPQLQSVSSQLNAHVKKESEAKLVPVEQSMVYEEMVEFMPTSNIIEPSQKLQNSVAKKGSEQGITETAQKNIKLNYEQMLPLWLNQFRVYPEEARKRGLKGEGVVFIKIDRQGNILFSQIRKTTGYEILDQALIDMLQRANPVVPLPSDYYPEKKVRSYEIKFRF